MDSSSAGTPIPFKETQVFVTPKERKESEATENKTIKDISTMCQQRMAEVNDSDMLASFEAEYNSLIKNSGKRATKSDYITFYDLLLEYLEFEASCILSDDATEETDI